MRERAHRRRRTVVVTAVCLALLWPLAGCSDEDAGGGGRDEAMAPGTTAGEDPTTPAPASTASTGRPLLDVSAMSTVAGTDGRTYLADEQGRAVLLRGANIKTREPAVDADDEALDDLAVRGFDLLRLSVYWHLLEPEQGRYDEAYLTEIGAALDRAEARGIHVIVSFHQDVFGPAFGDAGIPEWATRTEGAPFEAQDLWFMNYLQPAVQNAWEHLYEDEDLRQAQVAAWSLVAERFGDHPAVIGYDLLNEPFGKQREGEDLAAAATRLQATQLPDMYDRLIDGMRRHDPDGWMFVKPPNVALIGLPVTLRPPDDERVVFFPHLYDPNIERANYTDGDAELDLSFFEVAEPLLGDYARSSGLPTLIGEWGLAAPERPGMGTFVDESLALMDRVSSGWTVFTWCRGDGYCILDDSGADRPNIGNIVRPWVRAVAGAPTSTTYDVDDGVLRVVLDASGPGVATEVAVPRGADQSWQVAASAPEDGWSHEIDAEAGLISVTVESPGPVAVCVAAATPPACDAP